MQAARAGPGGNQPTLGVPANWGRHGTARTSADGRPAGDSEASGCGFFSEGHVETSAYRPSHSLSYLSSKEPPQGEGVLSSRGPPRGRVPPRGGGYLVQGTTAVGSRVPQGGYLVRGTTAVGGREPRGGTWFGGPLLWVAGYLGAGVPGSGTTPGLYLDAGVAQHLQGGPHVRLQLVLHARQAQQLHLPL